MYMSKKKFDEIKAKHSTTIVVDADVGEALAFVQDLLEAEADAIKNLSLIHISEPTRPY